MTCTEGSLINIVTHRAGDWKIPVRWPKLILFGDSHFQRGFAEGGIASLLADQLQRRVDVIVRGFSGYNTRFAKLVLDHVFDEFKTEDIAGVLLLFGSNDASVSTDYPLCQHTPLKEFSANVREIVERLIVRDSKQTLPTISSLCAWQARGIPQSKILLISPPPVDNARWMAVCEVEDKVPSPRDNLQVARYAQEMEEVAESHSVLFADLHHHLHTLPDWKEFFVDGLHLSKKGYLLFLETLQHNLESMLKEYPMIYPDWKRVDHQNPGSSLQ